MWGVTASTVRRALPIQGRSAELDAIEALLERLERTGRGGGTLVLAADPGLGRSTLVEHAAATFWAARPGRVLQTRAAPAQALLPYAGLRALLGTAGTPGGPIAGLSSADGRGAAHLLAALRRHAAAAPLLVCVDDAHLWDAHSRTALAAAARRLAGPHGIALVVTVSGPLAEAALDGLPRLRLAPLTDAAAGACLDDATDRTVAPAVRDALVAVAEGSPRLLMDLVPTLTPAQLAGRGPLLALPANAALRLSARTALVRSLPAATRRLLLLVAAAERQHPLAEEPEPAEGPPPEGADRRIVLRAAARAGISQDALAPAEAAGVLAAQGERLGVRPSVLRDAVYGAEPLAGRRAAHALLASALTGAPHRLARLLHRAAATDGPDAPLADALVTAAAEPCADLARSAALARAGDLTDDAGTRLERITAAAEHALLAGRPGLARRLLDGGRDLPARAAVRGRAGLVRGVLDLRDGPVADALEALLLAHGLLAACDQDRAGQALLAASEAAWASGDADVCRSALALVGAGGDRPGSGQGSPPGGLLDHYRAGLRALLSGRAKEGLALLRVCVGQAAGERDPARLLRAAVAALVLGDVDAACAAGRRALAVARAQGPYALVPQILERLAYSELRAGRHVTARTHAQDGLRAAHATGQRNAAAHLHAVLALTASVEDTPQVCARYAADAVAQAGPHGLAMAATLADWAVARADLAAGRAEEAAARLAPLVRPGPRQGHFAVRMLAVPCFVEAAVLGGAPADLADARRAADEFAVWAGWNGDPQAPAQLARCRALLARGVDGEGRHHHNDENGGGADPDTLYARAIGLHARAGGDFEGPRTQLLYGKWLRRHRRPLEARGHLRDALVGFERCGAHSWATQSRAELRATGAAGDRPQDGALAGLTPQQLRIARAVAEGDTNREVAARLGLSIRTVDHHLRNVFASLGIRSRVDLSRLVNRAES